MKRNIQKSTRKKRAFLYNSIMPRVSIILPTYNGAKYIAHAIESVRQQTYTDYEFLIINDGSTDETESIIQQYAKEDTRVHYTKNEKNLRLIRTLNRGLRLAKGEYIARIDDDDERVDPKKLEKQVEFLDMHSEYGLVGTSIITVDEKGREIGKVRSKETDQNIRDNILLYNQFLHPSVLIRKSIIDRIGWYDEKAIHVEDYDLWLRMGKVTKMYNLPDFTTKYMIRSGSISGKKQRSQKWYTFKTVIKYAEYYPNIISGVVVNVMNFVFPRILLRYLIKAVNLKDRVQRKIERTIEKTFDIDVLFGIKVKEK